MLKIYRLGIKPGEYQGEGEDHDEWFTSLDHAKDRRDELCRLVQPDTPEVWAATQSTGFNGEDFEIELYEFEECASRALAYMILNRGNTRARRWYSRREIVVQPAHFENGKWIKGWKPSKGKP